MSSQSDSKTGRKNAYDYLLENGPKLSDELPHQVTNNSRESGVCRFTFQKGSNTNRTTVYYVEGAHSPEDVIETWADGNEQSIKQSNNMSLLQSCPKPFREALKSVCDLDFGYSHSGAQPQGSGGECPLCGERYKLNLPSHLPCGGGSE